MTKMDTEHVKEHIETAIERAREGVVERIDELDRRLRGSLDFKQIAGDHAPQLLATGAALGFLLGFGAPRVITRAVQLAVPVLLAVKIAQHRRENQTLLT